MTQAFRQQHQQLLHAIAEKVNACILSGAHAQYEGPHLKELCSQISELYSSCGSGGVAFAFLTSSGTSALEVALRAYGVGGNDEVVISAYDYPGNFWAIERLGARPLLVDVEPDSWAIEHSFERRFTNRSLPKAVIVSHLHGQVQPLESLASWCKERQILLVEDCCQSFGTSLNGNLLPIVGDVAIISFGGGKVFSCGRGGCIVTHSEAINQRIRLAAGAGSGPNHLSELQAAALLPQISELGGIVDRLDQFSSELINSLRVRELMPFHRSTESVTRGIYQLGFICDIDRELLIDKFREAGLPAGIGFSGFHRRSERRCGHISKLLNAPRVASKTLTIHHSIAWAGQPASQVGQSINEIVSELSNKS